MRPCDDFYRKLLDASAGYRLLDHGEERKLESFGGIILDRPAPQATGLRMAPERWG